MNIEDMSMQEIIDYIHESKNDTEDAYNMRKNLNEIVSQVRTVMGYTYNFSPTAIATVMIDTLLTILDETDIMPRELFFIEFFRLLTDKYKDEYDCISGATKELINIQTEYEKSQETDEPMAKSTAAMKQMLVIQKYKARHSPEDQKIVNTLGDLFDCKN